MRSQSFVKLTERGIFCEPGGFYIDPWRPVKTALITHAHADHARGGSLHYWTSRQNVRLLKSRLGEGANIFSQPYGEPLEVGGVEVTFYPAGHILGSSQIRLAYQGEVVVVSGDYKRDPDPTCESFLPLHCDIFITESTFGFPIYKWPRTDLEVEKIFRWWQQGKEQGKNCVLLSYSLGKAQRIMAELSKFTQEPVLLHGATATLTKIYELEGVNLVPWVRATDQEVDPIKGGQLIIAPPSVAGSTWVKKFMPCEMGFASGWMLVKGNRRRRGYERGFVISDHCDFPSLIQTVEECAPKEVWVTHGNSDVLSAYLKERGWKAFPLKTEYEGEVE